MTADKSLLLIALLLSAVSSSAQKTVTVSGDVSGTSNKMIYLFQRNTADRDVLIDSTHAINDHFAFSKPIKEPNFFLITSQDQQGRILFVWDDNLHIQGKSSAIWQAEITGSRLTQEWKWYDKEHVAPARAKVIAWSDSIRKAAERGDTTTANALAGKQRGIADSLDVIAQQYIRLHPGSFISLFLLNSLRPSLDIQTTSRLLNSLSSALQQHSIAQAIKSDLKELASVNAGHPAPNFTVTDLSDRVVTLSAFKGAYVVLDFWGTWCGPCLKLIPETRKAYQKYKEKKVQFISIAYDNEKDLNKLRQLVSKNEMDWVQVFQNSSDKTSNSVVNKFRVDAFPSIILIDPKGNIIYRGTGQDGLAAACQLLDKGL